MRSTQITLAGACLTLMLWLGMASFASAAPPGFDLFETDPEVTQFSFSEESIIPAGFFDTQSEPFSATVHFGGVPLETFQGSSVGDADTVVQRPQAANLVAPFPSTDTIPIELVSLSLQSVAPIEVKVGTTTQEWDIKVDLSPTQPSSGEMTIIKTSEQGGTFSSQLLVLPRFTFTRISDNATRTLDVGQLFQSDPSFLNGLLLRADDVPWRDGCVAPALAVSGLNNNFCPGFTTDGQKKLTLEQSLRAQHGIRPAQPALEHFKCYGVTQKAKFKQRKVSLVDQFGSEQVKVIKPVDLCAPVKKNKERYVNSVAHLSCYKIKDIGGTFQSRTVQVRNQLGYDTLKLIKPKTLCLPSTKRLFATSNPTRIKAPSKLAQTSLIDHFKCYSAQGTTQSRTVSLKDQFGVERVKVLKPVQLCAPVKKNSTPSLHPVRHLVCYTIKDLKGTRRFRQRTVSIRNQFGVELLSVVRPKRLCVPSLKVAQ